MYDLSYLTTISLKAPTWTRLVEELHNAISLVEGSSDIVKGIRANPETLNALEYALALDNGAVELGGMYHGANLLPDGSLNDGDIVVMGRLVTNRVLLSCYPWDPSWVQDFSEDRSEAEEEERD